MKKMIALLGSEDEFKKSIVDYMKSIGGCKEEVKLVESITDSIPASLRIEPSVLQANQPYPSPILITESHLRQFFSRVQMGNVSLSLLGPTNVHTPKGLVNHFWDCGAKAFKNPDWALAKMDDTFDGKRDGVYVVTDLTYPEAFKLKELMGSNLALVAVLKEDEGDEVGGTTINPHGLDLILTFKPSKNAHKKTTENLLKTLKEKWKEKKK